MNQEPGEPQQASAGVAREGSGSGSSGHRRGHLDQGKSGLVHRDALRQDPFEEGSGLLPCGFVVRVGGDPHGCVDGDHSAAVVEEDLPGRPGILRVFGDTRAQLRPSFEPGLSRVTLARLRRGFGRSLLEPPPVELGGHFLYRPPLQRASGLHAAIQILGNVDGRFHENMLAV